MAKLRAVSRQAYEKQVPSLDDYESLKEYKVRARIPRRIHSNVSKISTVCGADIPHPLSGEMRVIREYIRRQVLARTTDYATPTATFRWLTSPGSRQRGVAIGDRPKQCDKVAWRPIATLAVNRHAPR
jgi:hypothetical protein